MFVLVTEDGLECKTDVEYKWNGIRATIEVQSGKYMYEVLVVDGLCEFLFNVKVTMRLMYLKNDEDTNIREASLGPPRPYRTALLLFSHTLLPSTPYRTCLCCCFAATHGGRFI